MITMIAMTTMIAIGSVSAGPLGRPQRNSCSVRQETQRFDKVQPVIVLDEVERITTSAAGMTLIEGMILVSDDRERGLVVIVERAQADMLTPFGTQRDVLADKRHKIRCVTDSINIGITRWHRHV